MAHDVKTTIAHAIHVAHHTEAGKKAIETIGKGALAVGTAAFAPIVGTAAAPVLAVAVIGWGLWRIFKD